MCSFAELADVAPEVLLIVEMIYPVSRFAVVADRGEGDGSGAAGIGHVMTKLSIEGLGFGVLIDGRDQAIKNLPTGQGPVLAILVEHRNHMVQKADCLGVRLISSDVATMPNRFYGLL